MRRTASGLIIIDPILILRSKFLFFYILSSVFNGKHLIFWLFHNESDAFL